MNLPFYIARRYLRARKSSNAIHILSGLSILGMGIGAGALILVMSVFNGFESLVFGLTNEFNPDIKIVAKEGKTFEADSIFIARFSDVEGIAGLSMVLEENALFAYGEVQDIGIIKGVDDAYLTVSKVDGRLLNGDFRVMQSGESQGVIGAGIAGKLGLDIGNDFEDLIVYMPNKKRAGPLDQPFLKRYLRPSGVFAVQPDVDMQYVITNLDFVQRITTQKSRVSALEISLQNPSKSASTRKAIQAMVGPDYIVKDRMMQEATFLKIMNLEKWVGFAIMCLIMFLVAFNIAGTLWMVVTEKKPDIAILKAMGAGSGFVQRIFLYNGLLLCLVAYVLGATLAVGFYLLQHSYGLIPVPPGFIIDAYPMELRGFDFILILITVLGIGALAAWLPARRAARFDEVLREE